MRRQAQDEVAEAARRRLERLGRELEQAGLVRLDGSGDEGPAEPLEDRSDGPGDPSGDLPEPAVVLPAGRHLRAPRSAARGRLTGRLTGWVVDQVPPTLLGRTGLSAGPAVLVALLVALGVGVTAVVVTRADGRAEVVAPRLSGTGAAPLVTPTASTSTTTSASAASSGASGGTVTVDVAGKVRRPGVTTLPAGSRVVDALAKAGGARGRADLSGLNLARVLVDGEQIVVGQPARPGGISASVASGAPAPAGPLVNLNTATAEQLDTLPGVGPVTAQKILSWRQSHGAFSSVDELLEVDGIGEKTLADLAPLVTL